MNKLKEIDILDKSKLALTSLFKNNISFYDTIDVTNKSDFIDGILAINSIEFSYNIMAKPTLGRISKQIESYKKISNLVSNPIFIVDYAHKELIEFFTKENLFFLDTVGNCFINLPSLKIFVEGRQNVFQKPSSKRAFQKTGLKLLFQLFKNPELANDTYRLIADKTNISLASVGYIFDELKNDGFIVEVNSQRRHLSNVKRLITKWAVGYSEIFRPTIHRGYFSSFNEENYHQAFKNDSRDLFIGGEYGAYYLNNSIKPERLIIYTNTRLSTLAKKYKIVPQGRSQNNRIEILEKFWSDESKEYKPAHLNDENTLKYQVVDPILIYADLMKSNNYRSIETAEAILKNEIRNRFLQHNFQW